MSSLHFWRMFYNFAYQCADSLLTCGVVTSWHRFSKHCCHSHSSLDMPCRVTPYWQSMQGHLGSQAKMSTAIVAPSVAKSSMLSSTRQQTRLFDRLRSRAVSLFLAEFRDVFLAQVPDKQRHDKEKKRKALEKVARLEFSRESEIVRQIWINKAKQLHESSVTLVAGQDAGSRSSGDASLSSVVPVESRSSASSVVPVEVRSSGDAFRSSQVRAEYRNSGDCLQSSGVLATAADESVLPLPSGTQTEPTTPPPRSEQLKKRKADGEAHEAATFVVRGLDAHWSDGPSELSSKFVRQSKHLRKLYGDAGALETLVAGVRISEAVDMKDWPDRLVVKVAVVAGMAAKLTQPPADEEHVRILWAKIAGTSSEPEIRKLEKKVLSIWARRGLTFNEPPPAMF